MINAPGAHAMTKNERRELDRAAALAAAGHRDMAARTIVAVYRRMRRDGARGCARRAVRELELTDRVVMVDDCLAHVDDVPAARS
jgi:hypothetical protein